jgi:DNA ligase 1
MVYVQNVFRPFVGLLNSPGQKSPVTRFPAVQDSVIFGAARKKPTAEVKPADSFSPMAAIEVKLSEVRYPVLVSPKMDGNRGVIRHGNVMARSTLPTTNPWIQSMFANRPELEGLDGEFILGEPNAKDVFGKTNGFVNSQETVPTETLTYQVFDLWNVPEKPYTERLDELKAKVAALPNDLKPHVQVIPQMLIHNEADLLSLEKDWVDKQGYEGLILRNPNAPYLQTRATMDPTDQALMKLKRFTDNEGVIIGFETLDPKSDLAKALVESGEATQDQLDALTPEKPALARYLVKILESGAIFRLGTGRLSLQERLDAFQTRISRFSQLVTFKHFGVFDSGKPRHPGFKQVRSLSDTPDELLAKMPAFWLDHQKKAARAVAVSPPKSSKDIKVPFMAPLPTAFDDKRLATVPLYFIDIETTGLEPKIAGKATDGILDDIIEIALVQAQGGKVKKRFTTLVKPNKPISPFVENKTQITNAMVEKDGIDPITALEQVRDFIGPKGGILVGHNARMFDIRFIRAIAERYGRPDLKKVFQYKHVIDTMDLSKTVFKGVPKGASKPENNKLGAVAAYYGITNPQAHRALADTLTTVGIFDKLLGDGRQKGATLDTVRDALSYVFTPQLVPASVIEEEGTLYH